MMQSKLLVLAAALGNIAVAACSSSSPVACGVDTDCGGGGGATGTGGATGQTTGTGGSTGTTSSTSTVTAHGGGHVSWELDGQLLSEREGAEGYFSQGAGGGRVTIYMPFGARNMQLTIDDVAMHPAPLAFASCADFISDVDFTVVTLPGQTPSLPGEWIGEDFDSHYTGCVVSPDVPLSYTLTISSLSASHAAGSFDVMAQGGGPRAGSTLHVFGDFDTDLVGP